MILLFPGFKKKCRYCLVEAFFIYGDAWSQSLHPRFSYPFMTLSWRIIDSRCTASM